MPDENWLPEACWFTKIFNMLILMLASGLGGVLFHYSFLRGLEQGSVTKGPGVWLRCVAASALMLAVCGSVIVQYFYENSSYILTLALWPAFILSLEPGYRVAGKKTEASDPDRL